MQCHLRLPQLAAILGMFMAIPAACSEPLFEFWDDFSKPACCHRDPFEERIETERHDFTQSVKTVGRGVVQIESGSSYFYKDDDDEIEDTFATPELLLRMGLSEDIEFRLRWNYGWRYLDDEKEKDGTQDLVWSLKLKMTEQDGLRPESASRFAVRCPPAAATGLPDECRQDLTISTPGN